jgi:hypothetical protein
MDLQFYAGFVTIFAVGVTVMLGKVLRDIERKELNERMNKVDESLTQRMDEMHTRIQEQLDIFDDNLFEMKNEQRTTGKK